MSIMLPTVWTCWMVSWCTGISASALKPTKGIIDVIYGNVVKLHNDWFTQVEFSLSPIHTHVAVVFRLVAQRWTLVVWRRVDGRRVGTRIWCVVFVAELWSRRWCGNLLNLLNGIRTNKLSKKKCDLHFELDSHFRRHQTPKVPDLKVQ